MAFFVGCYLTLEGQVVSCLFCRCCERILLGGRSRLGRSLISNGSGLTRLSYLCRSTLLHTYLAGVYLAHVKCTDSVKPASIIFMGIDVKGHIDLLTNLNVEPLYAISTEYLKHHFTGVCIMSLYDISLHFPFSAC